MCVCVCVCVCVCRLVSGDVEGNITQLYKRFSKAEKKSGPFDVSRMCFINLWHYVSQFLFPNSAPKELPKANSCCLEY